MAVSWGLEHRDLDNVTAIGIDEIAWRKRKDKIDSGCRRLLWVGQSRTKKTLQNFFDEFGKERSACFAMSALTCGSPTSM